MSKATDDRILPRSPAPPLSGVQLFANVIWRRSKAKIIGAFSRRSPDPPTDHSQLRCFPPEIVEMIIAHVQYDTPTLKACAATCFSWYNIATPHLHHTVTLQEWVLIKYRDRDPNPLPALFNLGLLPFVRRLQFVGTTTAGRWADPAVFRPLNMQYFRAMVNLQDLRITGLDFFKFPAGFGEYLGHFAPRLRSVALGRPDGTRRELLNFFKLFPELDNIEISYYDTRRDSCEALDSRTVPVTGGLRGRLTLAVFGEEGLLEDITAAFGGMRFTSMDLRHARGMQFLLKNCADTLETLRIYPEDMYYPSHRVFDPVYSWIHDFNLSCNIALRSIEVPVSSLAYLKQVLPSVTSPVFSEIVVIFSDIEVNRSSESVAFVMRELYGIKEFKMVICLEAPETSREGHQRTLVRETEEATSAGLYDFLPCPPLVFSRTAVDYSLHRKS